MMRSQEEEGPAQSSDPNLTAALVNEPAWLGGGTLVTAQETTLCAVKWIQSRQEWLSENLQTGGAVLLRGFKAISVEDFERIATIAGGGEGPQPYENRSTPRKRVKGNILTSTEYPASETITLHNENSYSSEWPGVILFLCQQPAIRGGETPIADSRRVYTSISGDTRVRFESRGVTYLRNYGQLGLSWQETFQTERQADVEEYCKHHGIEWKWHSDGGLQTRHTLPAARRHPLTGASVWFNQAHLFHVSSLGSVGDYMVEALGKDHLPRNASFGDGSEIARDLLDEIRGAYDKHEIVFGWKPNDLLILDNMLWAHGRRPFSGSRRVIVAMTRVMRGARF
jgi:alpha-ketoglutarate-dependent taurine dioxygenase